MEETLSKRERLILANQYDILSRLAEEEYKKKDFEDMRDIFTSGYTRYYSLATEHFSDEVNQDECKFVIDVLSLYRDLYYSRERSEEAKAAIEEKAVLFKGFDLNDEIESKYYSFYKFIVDQFGRYREIKELMEAGKIESYNSHGFGPSMRKLSAMISKWNEIKDRDEYNRPDDLTAEEISEILNVQY
ncbi:YfbU family protein [Bacillus pacificus]|uniref:YfbU family protein n=1 Tax=Bacillus pacificus TaxID=2026187 RepID=UPI0022B634AD|nr:YfbU family protein [Bacillus pacificus]